MALRLRRVTGLHERGDLDVGEHHVVERAAEQLRHLLVLGRRHVLRRRERALDDEVVGVDRPREVVDVGLLVRVGGGAVGVLLLGGRGRRWRRARSWTGTVMSTLKLPKSA